jgi:hypothetical protein
VRNLWLGGSAAGMIYLRRNKEAPNQALQQPAGQDGVAR